MLLNAPDINNAIASALVCKSQSGSKPDQASTYIIFPTIADGRQVILFTPLYILSAFSSCRMHCTI